MTIYDNRHGEVVTQSKHKAIKRALIEVAKELGYQVFDYNDYSTPHTSNIIIDTDNKVIAVFHDGRLLHEGHTRINSNMEPFVLIEKMFGSVFRDPNLDVPQLIE